MKTTKLPPFKLVNIAKENVQFRPKKCKETNFSIIIIGEEFRATMDETNDQPRGWVFQSNNQPTKVD